MDEQDRESFEDFKKHIQENLGFSETASSLVAQAADKLLDAGELFDEFRDYASSKDVESMRKTLINIFIAYLYDIEESEIFESLVEYMFPVLDNLSNVGFIEEYNQEE